jgi:hypothetical protein
MAKFVAIWVKPQSLLLIAQLCTPGACTIKLFTVIIYGFP